MNGADLFAAQWGPAVLSGAGEDTGAPLNTFIHLTQRMTVERK